MKEEIYFFLGNVFHHLSQALPLYRRLGGTFVVVTEQVYSECKKVGLPVMMLDRLVGDDDNSEFMPHNIPLTIDFLNRRSGWIFFFESYNIVPALYSLKKVMLFHGISLKTGWFLPSRVALLNCYDFITSLGPHQESLLLERAVDSRKLWQIGQTKNDDVINTSDKDVSSAKRKIKSFYPGKYKKVFTYFPTFFGDTTVDSLGLEVAKNIDSDFLLIVKLHGSTPQYIVDLYRELSQSRSNIVVYGGSFEGSVNNLELLRGSDAFFLDVSSMTFEALLTKKPLIFLINQKNLQFYKLIDEVFKLSVHIDDTNISELNGMISDIKTDKKKYEQAWQVVSKKVYYNLDGDAVDCFCSKMNSISEPRDDSSWVETIASVKRNERLIANLQQTANEARYLSYKTYELLTNLQHETPPEKGISHLLDNFMKRFVK
ncbi:MAG: CDP-glycerol glycerophosphotransferase family protein [Patescibacteria group bacterium]